MSRASLDSSVLFLAMLSLVTVLLAARIVRAPHRIDRPPSREHVELIGAFAAA